MEKKVIARHFAYRFPIPTVSIRDMNEACCEVYASSMLAGEEISPILVLTKDHKEGTYLVSEVIKTSREVYIIDGHHRYVAALKSGYNLRCKVVNSYPEFMTDYRDIATLYDFLDVYNNVQKIATAE